MFVRYVSDIGVEGKRLVVLTSNLGTKLAIQLVAKKFGHPFCNGYRQMVF